MSYIFIQFSTQVKYKTTENIIKTLIKFNIF